MSVNWWCSNEVIHNGTTLDWCCFANRACAEYVCGSLGASVEVSRSGNDPNMFNCLTNATSAIELYSNPPPNGTCANQVGAAGKGCLFNSANTQNATTTSSITTAFSSTTASSTSAAITPSGSGASSAGYQEVTVLGQTTLLGLLGMVWIMKKLY